MKQLNPCGQASPHTGQRCTMSLGHAGPHQAGGPYHTVEAWVTQCPDGKCDYHHNGMSIPTVIRWLECTRCGHKKPVPFEPYLLETPGGAVEILASNDTDAVDKAKQYLAYTRITTKGLKLFRYPKEWVNRPTAGLIEVPFYQLA
jgi:hypothetical protein